MIRIMDAPKYNRKSRISRTTPNIIRPSANPRKSRGFFLLSNHLTTAFLAHIDTTYPYQVFS